MGRPRKVKIQREDNSVEMKFDTATLLISKYHIDVVSGPIKLTIVRDETSVRILNTAGQNSFIFANKTVKMQRKSNALWRNVLQTLLKAVDVLDSLAENDMNVPVNLLPPQNQHVD